MLHGYREAELIAARTGAAKMGFFTSPAGDGFTADGYDDEDSVVPLYDAEAGTFHQLPAGVSFMFWFLREAANLNEWNANRAARPIWLLEILESGSSSNKKNGFKLSTTDELGAR